MPVSKPRIALLIAVLSMAAAQDVPRPVLTPVPGTVALYQFDEGAGTTTADSSGQARTGTLKNSPTWTAGIRGSALLFDTRSAFVEIPEVSVGSNWTLQGWTLFPLQNTADGWRTFVQNGASHHHVLVSESGELGTYVGSFQSSGYNVNPLAGWHLLTAVGSGGQTRFYIDERPVGASGAQETAPVRYIGNYLHGGQNWGTIDSFRILNLARSDGEIAADANPLPTAALPVQTDLANGTVPVGGAAHGGFSVRATVAHVPGAEVRLQVEIKPAGGDFDGAGLRESAAVASGSQAAVTVRDLPPGSYHWRFRAARDGAASDWTAFGGNADPDEVDIRLTNAAPLPAPLEARRQDGLPLAASPTVFDTEGIVFEAAGLDPDGDDIALEVEIQPVGAAFRDVPTASGEPVASGMTARCTAVTEDVGLYRVQGRIVDAFGAASDWILLGADDGSADFAVAWNGSNGSLACQSSAASVPAGPLPFLLLLLPWRRRIA